MVNFLFGLLVGLIVGMFINYCLKHVAMLLFRGRLKRSLDGLERDLLKAIEKVGAQYPQQMGGALMNEAQRVRSKES